MARPRSTGPSALRARLGALTQHARYDSRETTTAARASFLSRFEQEVDPDGVLDPLERAKRAEYARRAYFTRLALLSVQARSRRMKSRGT